MKIPGGGGGVVSKYKTVKGKYEAKLQFPEKEEGRVGRGGGCL